MKNKAFYNTQYNGKGFFNNTNNEKNIQGGPPGTAGSIMEGTNTQGTRFRSINAGTNQNNSGHQSPNQTIDVQQLPMRLVNQQKGGQVTNRKNRNGQASNNAKNAWQSIDASSINAEGNQN